MDLLSQTESVILPPPCPQFGLLFKQEFYLCLIKAIFFKQIFGFIYCATKYVWACLSAPMNWHPYG